VTLLDPVHEGSRFLAASFAAHGLHGMPEDRLHMSDFYEHARSESTQQLTISRPPLPLAAGRLMQCSAAWQESCGTSMSDLDGVS
jgi:hypothetical protein